ncbi:glutaminase [Insulibacter thermoxylanivorax]|uniref:Glutaminase n=1 Tax=Insulibacter thermoxylanivorax TaxID=2749268 RepID=A0A916QH15_9BACL|nr:glutaminase A [Insulibacter thermoxylanivorax]GFR38232.1 glutaminase [Insulibacter thermoxylanivorax]
MTKDAHYDAQYDLYDLETLQEMLEKARPFAKQGKVADYIPELAKASPETLGVTVMPIGQAPLSAGDCGVPFTMQSISKVFTLLLALIDHGEEKLFEHVGMEPTGDHFDSIVRLELAEPGKPFNPMINAGAIAVTSLIRGSTPQEKTDRILAFVRKLAADESIAIDEAVYRSEAVTADRNRSLAYFLKHNGVIGGDVEEHLEVYFRQCSIRVNCVQIARMGMILANGGIDPDSGEILIPERYVRIAKAFMLTCGMYNASGEFAIKVGIPAKSGVAGGILAVVPGRMGIGTISPALNEKGNSVAGCRILQELAARWRLSIY